MLVLSATATLAALLIAGWVIAGVLERFVVEGLDRRLDSEVALLAGAVDGDGRIDRDRLRQRQGAFENGPGWRWRIVSPTATIGSVDFPGWRSGPRGPLPLPPHDGVVPDDRALHPLDGSDARGGAVHARQLTIDTRAGPVTLIAAAPRAVIGRPIRGALTPLLAALASLAGLLVAATLVQLRVGLRPLRRLRDQVSAMRAGARDRADEDLPTELKGLAVELNALASDNAAALAAARLSSANLAHALKTPVAALALDLHADPVRAAQVARIDATIRHHLARARVDAIDRRSSTGLAPAVADLVEAIRRLYGERGLRFAVDIPGHLAVAVDPRDLDEMIGNLLDNAAKHAGAQVDVAAVRDPAHPRMVRVAIRDDGPGIAAVDRARVAEPGVRLDEHGEGHGFGLSIVANLASLYGGVLQLDDNEGGGLAVTLVLPASAADRLASQRRHPPFE